MYAIRSYYGLALPFLVSGSLFHFFLKFMQIFKRHIRQFEVATSVLLMVVGGMLFFDLFKNMSSWIYTIY